MSDKSDHERAPTTVTGVLEVEPAAAVRRRDLVLLTVAAVPYTVAVLVLLAARGRSADQQLSSFPGAFVGMAIAAVFVVVAHVLRDRGRVPPRWRALPEGTVRRAARPWPSRRELLRVVLASLVAGAAMGYFEAGLHYPHPWDVIAAPIAVGFATTFGSGLSERWVGRVAPGESLIAVPNGWFDRRRTFRVRAAAPGEG